MSIIYQYKRFNTNLYTCINEERISKKQQVSTYELPIVKVGSAKEMQNTRLYMKLIVIALLIGMFTIAPALSALTSTKIIGSAGTIRYTTEVTALSGYPDDLQAAVDAAAAAGGGTVHVPAGTFDWDNQVVTIPSNVYVIGASPAGTQGHASSWAKNTASTIIRQTHGGGFRTMFQISGNNIRISGLELRGLVTRTDPLDGKAISIEGNSLDYRIDHCTLIDFPNTAISCNFDSGLRRGVVDHCIIENPYKLQFTGSLWGYGIVAASDNYKSWDDEITHFLGKYEQVPTLFPTIYIEDNFFNLTRHAVASNQLGWYCFRYNYVYQTYNSAVDVHGSSESAAGGRGAEVYGNTILSPIGIGFRGGSGVIYNNDVSQCTSGIYITKDISGIPLRPMNDLWIWDNDGTFVNYDDYYVENVNYFRRSPTVAQDGFTYTPYTYPHPLILQTEL